MTRVEFGILGAYTGHKPRSFDFLGRKGMVSFNGNRVYLHLGLLVDVDVHDYPVGCRHIVPLQNAHLGILVTFVIEILLDKEFGTVYHIRGQLIVLQQTDTLLQIFPFALLYADIVNLRHARTLRQLNAQEGFVADYTVPVLSTHWRTIRYARNV